MSLIKRLALIALKYIEYTNYFLLVLSMLAIATLMVIVTYQVFMRYFFDRPTGWVFELAEYGMVFIVFLPLAIAEQYGQHIRVDAITHRLSEKMNARLNFIALAVSLFYIGIFIWSSIRYTRIAYERDWNSGQYNLGLDKWPILAFITAGLFLLWLNLLVSFIKCIASLISKWQDNIQSSPNNGEST